MTKEYSNITKNSISYDKGLNLTSITSDSTKNLTGILIGDINDSYSNLIA